MADPGRSVAWITRIESGPRCKSGAKLAAEPPEKDHSKTYCRKCKYGDPKEERMGRDKSGHCLKHHQDIWDKCSWYDHEMFEPRKQPKVKLTLEQKYAAKAAKLKTHQQNKMLRLIDRKNKKQDRIKARQEAKVAKEQKRQAKQQARQAKKNLVNTVEIFKQRSLENDLMLMKLKQQLQAQAERIQEQEAKLKEQNTRIENQFDYITDRTKPVNFDAEFAKWEMKKGTVEPTTPKPEPSRDALYQETDAERAAYCERCGYSELKPKYCEHCVSGPDYHGCTTEPCNMSGGLPLFRPTEVKPEKLVKTYKQGDYCPICNDCTLESHESVRTGQCINCREKALNHRYRCFTEVKGQQCGKTFATATERDACPHGVETVKKTYKQGDMCPLCDQRVIEYSIEVKEQKCVWCYEKAQGYPNHFARDCWTCMECGIIHDTYEKREVCTHNVVEEVVKETTSNSTEISSDSVRGCAACRYGDGSENLIWCGVNDPEGIHNYCCHNHEKQWENCHSTTYDSFAPKDPAPPKAAPKVEIQPVKADYLDYCTKCGSKDIDSDSTSGGAPGTTLSWGWCNACGFKWGDQNCENEKKDIHPIEKHSCSDCFWSSDNYPGGDFCFYNHKKAHIPFTYKDCNQANNYACFQANKTTVTNNHGITFPAFCAQCHCWNNNWACQNQGDRAEYRKEAFAHNCPIGKNNGLCGPSTEEGE
jgi:hypothetical protein